MNNSSIIQKTNAIIRDNTGIVPCLMITGFVNLDDLIHRSSKEGELALRPFHAQLTSPDVKAAPNSEL